MREGRARGHELPLVLVATPVKDAVQFLETYLMLLSKLTYPRKRLSIALLESDSEDGTFEAIERLLPRLRRRYRRAGLWKHDFGYRIPAGTSRWTEELQEERRGILARSRNHLLAHGLVDEAWVL